MSDPRINDPVPRCQHYRSGVQCRFSPRHPGEHEFIDKASELRAENERLRQQLAAMTKARDEACNIAAEAERMLPAHLSSPRNSARLRELRKVGAL